jgi:hypothetical protein
LALEQPICARVQDPPDDVEDGLDFLGGLHLGEWASPAPFRRRAMPGAIVAA